MPRGADAVVMVEHADVRGGELRIARAVTAGSGVSFAGTDITAGETVLRRGQLLTSRDTGVLAAIGVADVDVWRKPVVAILSTGDEIIAPGEPMQPAQGLRLERAGAGRRRAGAGRRAAPARHHARRRRRACASGCATRSRSPTSCCCRAARARAPATCRIASSPSSTIPASSRTASRSSRASRSASRPPAGAPVVVLPGFPTSAIFTFHEFVAPVHPPAGRPRRRRNAPTVPARLAVKVNSEIGRTEYLLVGLVETPDGERRAVARGVSDGTGLRQRHHVQPRRRLRDHRPARGDRAGRHGRSTCSCSAAICSWPIWS